MVDTWVVFGGWALGTDALKPLFGPTASFIDANPLMPHLVDDEALTPDWQERLEETVAPRIPKAPFGIAGWSTGALLAYALAQRTKPAGCVLISATPSFCRKPGFPYGQKAMVLQAMREQMESDPARVLEKFYAQCGIGKQAAEATYRTADLTAGLTFLQHATLFPAQKLPCPSLFLHGKDDAVIPAQAGAFLCRETGGTFAEHAGPHAFFMAQPETVAASIKRFIAKGAS